MYLILGDTIQHINFLKNEFIPMKYTWSVLMRTQTAFHTFFTRDQFDSPPTAILPV